MLIGIFDIIDNLTLVISFILVLNDPHTESYGYKHFHEDLYAVLHKAFKKTDSYNTVARLGKPL